MNMKPVTAGLGQATGLSREDELAFWSLTDDDPAKYPPEVVQQVLGTGKVDSLKSAGWTPLIAGNDMDVNYEMNHQGPHDGRGVRDTGRLERVKAALTRLHQ